MSDRGARALANRLAETDTEALTMRTLDLHAQIILGANGLFIADVGRHEPFEDGESPLRCSCGWQRVHDETYWDHIGAAQ